MFVTVPITRYRPGECGSVCASCRALRLGHVLAPHVGEAEEEALLGREAVDVLARLARQGLLERA